MRPSETVERRCHCLATALASRSPSATLLGSSASEAHTQLRAALTLASSASDRLQHPKSLTGVGRGGREVERTREHSQLGEVLPVGLLEQRFAPLQCRAQALLPVGKVPGTIGEEAQPLLEAIQNRPGRPHPRLGGRELDRQGKPVDRADLSHRLQRFALRRQTGLCGSRSLQDELNGFAVLDPGLGGAGVLGQGQRRYAELVLAVDVQRDGS